ncbi:HIT family protein, partial [Listeria monocytogenes]|nr:HIT family protein [Listeria monocytogenes]
LPIQGLNILNNNEEVAFQSVFHCHIHLIPRYSKSDDFGLKWKDNADWYTQERYQEIAELIAAKVD